MKSYLVTGATGFLGRHLVEQLSLHSHVVTLGRTENNTISCNLAHSIPVLPILDCVIHNAGKAHLVPKTEKEKQDFFQVNHQGTLHLLKGLEHAPRLPKQFIFISTVAVYGLDTGEYIDETYPLLGESPYSKSKILAEQAIQTWCAKHGVVCLILRLPLVFGHNPPGNLGAIAKMIKQGSYVRIAGNKARKSMVLAEDVAELLLRVDGKSGIYNLTDGVHPSFEDLEQGIARLYGRKIRLALPMSLLKLVAGLGDRIRQVGLPFPLTSDRLGKMTATLTFEDERARRELGWKPRAVMDCLAHLL